MAIGIVETKYGKLQGVEFEGKYAGITEFQGVPYAKPPVGALRWRPPQDPEPWEGVRACDTYGDMCVQQLYYENIESSVISRDDYYYMELPPMSEDCLYINITTGARRAGEKRPVYLWHHGGGLTNGYAHEVEFDPCELASKGVIVVTVNQRLNLFGYMSLPQISAEQGGKSGNYGLMDTLKALDWVYENIERFGGDPDNITVGGQSGGTHRAMAMASTPMNKGRVRRVIAQSWILWYMKYHTMQEAEQIGQEYLEAVGIDPNLSLEELRALPAERIFSAAVERNTLPGDMVWDGEYVPFPTRKECLEKFAEGVDFLGGCNMGEVDPLVPPGEEMFFTSHHGKPSNLGFEMTGKLDTAQRFYQYYREMLGELYHQHDFEKLVPVTDETAWFTARRLATLGLCRRGKSGAAKSIMMHRIFGRYMKQRYPQGRYYTYMFSHLEPVRPQDYGTSRDPQRMLAWHSSELWYTFNSMRPGIPPTRPWREIDYQIAGKISSYWANFMWRGDPNGEGLPHWPAAHDDFGWMDLDTEFRAGQGVSQGLDALLFQWCCREYELTV